MNDKRFHVIFGLLASIVLLLGTLAFLQYQTLQRIPHPITLATIREAKTQTERIKLIQELPLVRVHSIGGAVAVEVQNTVDVDVINGPLR